MIYAQNSLRLNIKCHLVEHSEIENDSSNKHKNISLLCGPAPSKNANTDLSCSIHDRWKVLMLKQTLSDITLLSVFNFIYLF